MSVARAVARAVLVAIAVTALIMLFLYAAGVGADFGPVEQPHTKHIKLL
jgi:hypothetical protein